MPDAAAGLQENVVAEGHIAGDKYAVLDDASLADAGSVPDLRIRVDEGREPQSVIHGFFVQSVPQARIPQRNDNLGLGLLALIAKIFEREHRHAIHARKPFYVGYE
jgi:hypothetical protein